MLRSRRSTPDEVWHAAHSMATSCSTSLFTRSPSAASITRPVAFSTEPLAPAASRSASTRYDGASLCPGWAYVFQPMMPTRLPGPIPSSARISASGARSVARLARQAQVLEPLPPHRQRRRPGDAPALVADQDGGITIRPHDQHRLLETRVEAGQVGQVGAVLAIGVDHQTLEASGVGSLAETRHRST